MVGAMLVAAFGAFSCSACGKIESAEFSPEVRGKMRNGSIAMAVGALVILVVVVVVLMKFAS